MDTSLGKISFDGLPELNEEIQKLIKELQSLQSQFKKVGDTSRDYSNTVKEQTTNTGGFNQSFLKLTASFVSGQAIYNGLIAVGRKFIDFLKESTKVAIEEEANETKLLNVLGNNKEAYKRMLEFKEKNSKSTIFSKDEIENAINVGIGLGRTEEETQKMLVAAEGLSRVMGVSLDTAMITLSSTLEGTKGRLGRYASEIKNMDEQHLKAGDAIDVIYNKFGKLSTQGINTAEGAINQYSKALEELQITMGNKILPSLSKFYKSLTDIVKATDEWISGGQIESIKQEQIALNDLVFTIMETNDNQAERNRLIDELKQKYPSFLGDLKNEQVTNEALNRALEQVNNQYLAKIRNIQNEKVLTELAENQAEAFDKQTEAHNKFTTSFVKLLKLLEDSGYQSNLQIKKQIDGASTMTEKMEIIRKKLGGIGGTGAEVLAFFEAYKEAVKESIEATNGVSKQSFEIVKKTIQDNINLTGGLTQVPDNVLQIAKKGYEKIINELSPTQKLEEDKQQIIKILSDIDKEIQNRIPKTTKPGVGISNEDYNKSFETKKKQILEENRLTSEGLVARLQSEKNFLESREILTVEDLDRLKSLNKSEEYIKVQGINNTIEKLNTLNQEYKRRYGKDNQDILNNIIDLETQKITIQAETITKQSNAENKYKQDQKELEQKSLEEYKDTLNKRKEEFEKYLKKQDSLEQASFENLKKYNYSGEFENLISKIIGTGEIEEALELEEKRHQQKIFDIEKEYLLDLALAGDNKKMQEEAYKLKEEKINKETDLYNKYKGNITGMLNEIETKSSEVWKDLLNIGVEIAGKIANTIFNIIQQSNTKAYQDALDSMNASYETEYEQIEKLKEKKQISDEEYARRKKEIDKRKAEEEKRLKKEQAKADWEAAIAQSIINTALAATLAYAQGGPIAGIALAAIVAALGAIETALIIATGPAYRKGGIVKGGLLQGPSHEEGGIPLGPTYGTAEGNEYIISKQYVKPDTIPILNSINNGQPIGNTVINNYSLNPEDISTIVTEVTKNITNIPVTVLETDITETQRKVKVYENKSTW